jgi:hypothetical protein
MNFSIKSLVKAAAVKASLGGLSLVSGAGAIFIVYKDGMDSIAFWAFFIGFAVFGILFTINLLIKGNKDEKDKNKNRILDSGGSDPILAANNSGSMDKSALEDYSFLIKYLKDYDISERVAKENIDEYRKFTQYMLDKETTLKEIKEIVDKLYSRPLLLDHMIFTTGYIECLDRIAIAKYNIDEKSSEIRKSIPDYITLVVKSLIEGHKAYIEKNSEMIYKETEKVSIQQYLKEFLETRNRMREDARSQRYDERLIHKFGERVAPALERFKNAVIREASSSLNYNDYTIFNAILGHLMVLLDWITDEYLDVLLNMNGELEGNHE